MRTAIWTCVAMLAASATIADELPLAADLAPPEQIRVGDIPLDVEREGHSAPEVGDFDGDGIRDLLVGQYEEGKLRIYRNVGTNENPRFDAYTWFIAGGEVARVPEGCCIGFSPQLIDLDRDGRTDVISGSWPGEIYFFRCGSDGAFLAGRQLPGPDGKPINLGHRGSAFVVDWDANGTLDLVVGNINGEIYFLSGKLSDGQPSFGEPQRIAAGGAPIQIEYGQTSPIAADWDTDGRLDLIVGTGEGSVLWYRNLGTRHEPKLEAAQTLLGVSPAGWVSDDRRAPRDWGVRVKPCVVDWNGDGRPDLLVGDRCGSHRAKPSQTDAEQQEERQANDRLPELRRSWAAAFQEYQRLQTTSQPEDKLAPAREQLRRLKDEMARLQTIQEHYQPGYQSHGFVWLFLRRSVAVASQR